MCTYASFRVKRKSFYKKVNSRGFCWFPAAILVDQTVHRYGASIQSSTKVRGTFRQITQKLWVTKTWDLEKLFIYYSFITSHFLGFFHRTVSNFLCVSCLLRDSVNELCQWYFFTSFFLLSRMSSSRNSKRSTDPRFSKSTILSLLDNKWPQARATGVKRTWRGLSNIAARLTSLNVEFHMCRTEFLF